MKNLLTRIAAYALPLAMVASLLLAATDPAEARRLKRPYHMPGQGEFVPLPPDAVDYAQNQDYADPDLADPGGQGDAGVSIRPREAARIARQAVPGAKVLNVKLLPSGVYAVTLRGDGKLTRVMVDGRSGDIL
jgi:hypothetical protein